MSDANAGETERRASHLAQLRRILPPSPPWEVWLSASGELPPDFAAMTACNALPDALRRSDGTRVTSAADWRARRAELLPILEHWLLGRSPPPPPEVRAEIQEESRVDSVVHRRVMLSFGPQMRGRLRVELTIPPGDGPLPVFMSQFNHRHWIKVAVRRGYLGCIYAASDNEDDSESLTALYPDHDFARIARRAWCASRAIDHLASVPQADVSRIALTGHSRNGKQSVIAAALDERIAMVVPSSPGAGGTCAMRWFSEHYPGQGIEQLTRQFPAWFHPRLRFFSGREDRLPFDLHELIALVAPRPCVIGSAINDPFESAFAADRTVAAARPVYELLGAADRLRIGWRWGGHETSPGMVERYVDWCDHHFRGGAYLDPERAFPAPRPPPPPRSPIVRVDATAIATADQSARARADVRTAIGALCGTPPPAAPADGGLDREQYPHTNALLLRGWTDAALEARHAIFGEFVRGDVYARKGTFAGTKRLPAVVYLHPPAFQHGYSPDIEHGVPLYHRLAALGFVTLGYDQIGFGGRIEEGEDFYRNYPRWSLFGKMLRDARAGVDLLTTLPFVDPTRVWMVGHHLGAMQALHAAALDERIAGVIALSPTQPWRQDIAANGRGGLRRWSHDIPLLPALGSYIGDEGSVPYDLPELLGAIAPRPCTVIRPVVDRESLAEDIAAAVDTARRVYALDRSDARLELIAPDTSSSQTTPMQDVLLAAFTRQAGAATAADDLGRHG